MDCEGVSWACSPPLHGQWVREARGIAVRKNPPCVQARQCVETGVSRVHMSGVVKPLTAQAACGESPRSLLECRRACCWRQRARRQLRLRQEADVTLTRGRLQRVYKGVDSSQGSGQVRGNQQRMCSTSGLVTARNCYYTHSAPGI